MADVIKYRFRCRRRTAAEWTSVNEILLAQEIGLEEDTGLGKIGDGSTPWNDLLYTIVGQVDLAGLADGKCLAWDATQHKWRIADRGVTYVSGSGINIDDSNPEAPIISSTLGSIHVDDQVSDYASLPSPPPSGKTAYYNEADGLVYIWNGSAWPAEGDGIVFGSGSNADTVSNKDIDAYDAVVLSASPYFYYKLDEPPGATMLMDSSGNANHLEVVNPSKIVFQNPYEMFRGNVSVLGTYFNDATGYARDSGYPTGSPTAINGFPLTMDGSWTFEGVLKIKGTNPSIILFQRIGKNAGTSTGSDNCQFQIRINAGSFYMFWQSGSHVANSITIGSASKFFNGPPFLLTLVKDSSAKKLRLYTNGIKQYEVAYTSEPAGGSLASLLVNQDLSVGFNQGAWCRSWMAAGVDDDATILSRAKLLKFANDSGVADFNDPLL